MDGKVLQFPSRIKLLVAQEQHTDAAEDLFDMSVTEIFMMASESATQVLQKEDPVRYANIHTVENLMAVANKTIELLMATAKELRDEVEYIKKQLPSEPPDDGA